MADHDLRGAPNAERPTEHLLPERLEPVPLPKSYFWSSLATFCGLSLLLCAYLMLTLGLPAGFIWLLMHAIDNDWMSGNWEWTFWLFVFGGPMIFVTAYFMILPMFSRRGLRPRYLSLTERQQGRFFLFLRRLCKAMDAPMPDEVVLDCQANASVRRISPLRSRERLQLMIGTPLIEGLTAVRLAGVITHELAHFRQRGGRRLGYAIATLGNLFETLAEHRGTRQERMLAEKFRLRQDLKQTAIYGGTLALVAAARKICRGLAWIGRIIGSRHSRQLEFDADRWQARLIGNARFADLMREIVMIDIAHHQAFNSMPEHQEENRFPIDLADYGMAFRALIDEETETAIWMDLQTVKTGLFDSHPSIADRLANVREFERNPSPEYDVPARELFRDWKSFSQLATRVEYCRVLGEAIFSENLHTSRELLGDLERNQEAEAAHLRYFAGAWPWIQLLRLGMMADYVTTQMTERQNVDLSSAARRQLDKQRDIMRGQAPQWNEARERLGAAFGRYAQARTAEHLLEAGAVEVLRKNRLPQESLLLVQQQQAALREIRRCEEELLPAERATTFRLALALSGPGGGELAAELREQAAPLIAFVRALEPEVERIRGILVEHRMLQAIEDLGDEYLFPPAYLEKRTHLARGLMSRLKQIYFNLEEVPYVLGEERQVMVSSWLLQIPESTVPSILHSASVLLDNLPGAIFRTLGQLAQIAEKIEMDLGLAPIDLTPRDPEA